MTETIILHHYRGSPYSEKIRLMFGYAGMRWLSLLSPPQPPRPNLDPLTGGYRRIPVAQIGADIFCDTAIIANELARIAGRPELDPAGIDGPTTTRLEHGEGEVLGAALAAIPPYRLLTAILLSLGPVGAYRLVKDRQTAFRGGSSRQPRPQKAKGILQTHLQALEARLQGREWVDGDRPSLADFANYHPLWGHGHYGGGRLDTGPRVREWFRKVADFGHGVREEVSREQVFAAARDAAPRALPDSVDDAPVAPGSVVSVAPVDYCVIPVTGTVAALTAERIILARETQEFGTLHVHFPRAGYAITAQ